MAKKTAGIYREEKFEFESINRLMYFGYDKNGDCCSERKYPSQDHCNLSIYLSISV